MELEWMMLANHAEVAGGLVYISGGTWDTVNVIGPPPEGAPEGVVGAVQGTLIVRLSFHATEEGNEYPLHVTIVEEDGDEIASVDGTVNAQSGQDDVAPRAPATWRRGVNVLIPLTGLPLPRFGEYRINFSLNREYKGDLPFRVLRAY
jgi:hypothetical protein